jgi:hypothetical protein
MEAATAPNGHCFMPSSDGMQAADNGFSQTLRQGEQSCSSCPPKEIPVKRLTLALVFVFVCVPIVQAQNPDVRFIADTLIVQAEGTYETDPDLATLTFHISSQR